MKRKKIVGIAAMYIAVSSVLWSAAEFDHAWFAPIFGYGAVTFVMMTVFAWGANQMSDD